MDAFSILQKLSGEFEVINNNMNAIYQQLNRRQEVLPSSYLTMLNCNEITSVFRTVPTNKPFVVPPFPGEPSTLDLNNILTPTITIEFSEPGQPMILGFDIMPKLSSSISEEYVLLGALYDFCLAD